MAKSQYFGTSARRVSLAEFIARKDGGIAVVFGLITPVLISFVGLASDAVFWYLEQHKLQAATDQAALSAAYVLRSGQNGSALDAETNRHLGILYDSDIASLSVEVNNPPLAVSYAGNANAVEVITSKPQPVFFLKLFNIPNVTVSARAISTYSSQTDFCILGLSNSEDKAVEFTGSAAVHLGCGIASNSESSDAVYISGNSSIDTTGISSVGDILQGGSSAISVDIPLKTHAPSVLDPYGPDGRNIEPPAFPTACSAQNLRVNSDTTLSPGRYCGGISFQGGTTTMNPGVYLIDAGNFKAVGGASITGQDVTIILTGSGSKFAELELGGGADLSLHAPKSGTDFDGILFFQDQNAPAYQGNNLRKNKIVGNSNLDLSGAIYFPHQELQFSGATGGQTSCLQLVAAKVSFTGNSTVTNSCDASNGTDSISHTSIRLVD